MVSDELDTVIMRKVLRALGGQTNDVHQWLSNESKSELDNRQKAIDRLREWAKTLTDKRIRNCYLGWIDFCQNGLDEAYKELRTGKMRREHEEYRREQDQHYAAVTELEHSQQVPSPPRRLLRSNHAN